QRASGQNGLSIDVPAKTACVDPSDDGAAEPVGDNVGGVLPDVTCGNGEAISLPAHDPGAKHVLRMDVEVAGATVADTPFDDGTPGAVRDHPKVSAGRGECPSIDRPGRIHHPSRQYVLGIDVTVRVA